MDDVLDSDNDAKVRAALRDADEKGKLSILERVTGYPERKLRDLMHSGEPMSFKDRAWLMIHLQVEMDGS